MENNDFWLKFNSLDRKFTGIPSYQLLNSKIQVKVVATDGYSDVSDILEIAITKIPIMFVLHYIITIGAPVVGLLGILNYRSYIYSIVCKSKF